MTTFLEVLRRSHFIMVEHNATVETFKDNVDRSFAKRLASARDFCGYTQADLAKRSGVQASAISHFESGRRKPSLENFRRIVIGLYHVSADYLLGLTDVIE